MKSAPATAFLAIAIVLTIVSVLLAGTASFNRSLVYEPEYANKIGDLFLNAADAPRLELFINYTVQARTAMHEQGLTNDLYNSPWGWDHTPQNKMLYQYQYVDSMIALAQYYVNQTSHSNVSTFSDVYKSIMSNLRNETVRNGPFDWVAHWAWLLKYHPDAYWAPYYWLYVVGAIILVIIAIGAYTGRETKHRQHNWD